jgi:adenosylcobinamide hydrolase
VTWDGARRAAGPPAGQDAAVALRPRLDAGGLVVELGAPQRCLSSALLGGGLGWLRTWLNLQVAPDYARTDPEAHLASVAAGLPGPVVGMMTAARVAAYQVGSAPGAGAVATVGVGHALAAAATRPRPAPAAGAGGAAATGPAREHGHGPRTTDHPGGPGHAPRASDHPGGHGHAPRASDHPGGRGGGPRTCAGTINLLVVVDQPLTDAGLAGALQTAVEAKAQALAAAQVPAANAGGFATGTATDALCVACPPGSTVPFAGPATRVGGDLARAVFEAVLAGALADRLRPRRPAAG